MSCLLYFCNSTFDEPYSFSWFSYPRAVMFWKLIIGSLDTLLFSFLLFQKITCAVLVESGRIINVCLCWSEFQGPYEVYTSSVHCSSAFLKLGLLDGTFQLVVVCQGSGAHELWVLSIPVPLLQKAASQTGG